MALLQAASERPSASQVLGTIEMAPISTHNAQPDVLFGKLSPRCVSCAQGFLADVTAAVRDAACGLSDSRAVSTSQPQQQQHGCSSSGGGGGVSDTASVGMVGCIPRHFLQIALHSKQYKIACALN